MSEIVIVIEEIDVLRAELEDSRVETSDLSGRLRDVTAERDEARHAANRNVGRTYTELKRADTYRAIIKGLAKRVRTFRTAYWRQVDADLERDTDAIAALALARRMEQR